MLSLKETQGAGLSALATVGQPDVVPFGDTTMYVKGEMNGWSNDDAMSYAGSGVYKFVKALEVGTYQFKVADADWTDGTNFGVAEENTTMQSGDSLELTGSNNNITIETLKRLSTV